MWEGSTRYISGCNVALVRPEDIVGIRAELVKGLDPFGRAMHRTNEDLPWPIFPTTIKHLFFSLCVSICINYFKRCKINSLI